MSGISPALPTWTAGVWGTIWAPDVWQVLVPSTVLRVRVDARLDGTNWTELTDVFGVVTHSHGIPGDEPQDVVAGSGELTFSLRNDSGNSGGTLGWYSPGHASCRSGWAFGVPVRVVYTLNGQAYTRWRGKVATIDPSTAPNNAKVVRVVAYDHMHDLVEASCATVACQVGATDSAIIGEILDSLPVAARPPARDIEAGLDNFSFALDRLTTNTEAAQAILQCVRSSCGLAYCNGLGTFVYRTRQTRFTASSSITLTDAISELSVPASREGLYNVVRMTMHPKHTTDGVVLWAYSGDTPEVIPPLTVITRDTYYRDPDQTSKAIGAAALSTLVAETDFIANAAADGSGLDLTWYLFASVARYAAFARWTIGNTSTAAAHLTTWQLRGTAVFDDAPLTVEARSAQPYGERVLDIDLPYQGDPNVAEGLAMLFRDQRQDEKKLVSSVGFYANLSDTLATFAMIAEPGTVMTLSNAMTGLSSATAEVRRLEYQASPDGTVHVRIGVVPTSTITTPPSTPTGLTVSTLSDSQLTVAWTNTDASAETEIYVDGVFYTAVPAGTTTATIWSLTRATTYTITLKHVKYALIRSAATAGVTGRPTVIATGGSYSTFSSLGVTYQMNTFTSSGNYNITAPGLVSFALAAAGGGAGASDGNNQGSGGGGGGEVVLVVDTTEPTSASQGFPSGYPVVIGAPGAGDTSGIGNAGGDGGNISYRSNLALGGGGGGSFRAANGFNGRPGGSGGGGAVAGTGGVGNVGGAGGNGGADVSGQRTGGGGGGAGGVGGNGVTGGTGSAVGGAGGAGFAILGLGGFCVGGQGGGPSGGDGENATNWGCGGNGKTNGNGGDGFQGIAQFWFPI